MSLLPWVSYLSLRGRTVLSAAAMAHGIRSDRGVSRPGMGGSTFQPARTRSVDGQATYWLSRNHLQVARFAVLRVSAGASYALSCGSIFRRIDLGRYRSVLRPIPAAPRPQWDDAQCACACVACSLGFRVSIRMLLDLDMTRPRRTSSTQKRFDNAMMASLGNHPAVDKAALETNAGGLRDAILKRHQRRTLKWGGLGQPWGPKAMCRFLVGYDLQDIQVGRRAGLCSSAR